MILKTTPLQVRLLQVALISSSICLLRTSMPVQRMLQITQWQTSQRYLVLIRNCKTTVAQLRPISCSQEQATLLSPIFPRVRVPMTMVTGSLPINEVCHDQERINSNATAELTSGKAERVEDLFYCFLFITQRLVNAHTRGAQ